MASLILLMGSMMQPPSHHKPDKTEATPQQIGRTFVDFIVKRGKAKNDTTGVFASLSELDRNRVLYETLLLIGWINEYITWDLFRDQPEKAAILTAYYSLIDSLALNDANWRTFDLELRKRIPVYAEIVKAGIQKAQIEQIGCEFARFCGNPDEGLFLIAGSTEFAANYAATLEFLASLKVVL
jgi:hypothetical protein